MKLYIDGIQITDFDQNGEYGVTFEKSAIEDVDSEATDSTTEIDVPITPVTRRIFGYADDLHARSFFNQSLHRAILEQEEIVVADGYAFLTESNTEQVDIGSYKVSIVGAGKSWAVQVSNSKLNEIQGLTMEVVNADTLVGNWSNTNNPIQLFLVQRSNFLDENKNYRCVNFMDLHPFFHLRTVLKKIFENVGYTLVSDFIDGTTFNGLYMSGKVTEQDESNLKESCGFKAGRELSYSYTPTTYNDFTNAHTHLVTTANSSVNDSFYNNGGAFRDETNTTFTPTEDCAVQYKVCLKYHTNVIYTEDNFYENTYDASYWKTFSYYGAVKNFDIKIKQVEISDEEYNDSKDGSNSTKTGYGTEIKFFNGSNVMIFPGTGWYSVSCNRIECFYKMHVFSSYNDAKNGSSIVQSISFHSKNEAIVNLSTGAYVKLYQDFGGRETIVFNPKTYQFKAYTLPSNGSSHVMESEVLTPHPLYCKYGTTNRYNCGEYSISLSNSNAYPTLIVDKATTVETVFPKLQIGLNGSITASNSLVYEEYQSALLKAVKHLFNLRFITDEPRKLVYIEPRNTFFSGPVIDWADKIDHSEPITIQELGSDLGKNFCLMYNEDDESVQEYNKKNPILAKYTAAIFHQFANKEDTECINEFFTSSISTRSFKTEHPNLIKVNDEGNFSARVVKYMGVVGLTENGDKMWPSKTSYPFITFRNREYNVNFGFNDIEKYYQDIEGLHKYYDSNINAFNFSRRITVFLYLTEKDIEGFARLTDLKMDFRATYKLLIDGEYVFCELERIENFCPGAGVSTKCVFIKKI